MANKELCRVFLERERVQWVLKVKQFLLMWNVIVINSNYCEYPAQSPDLNTIEVILADLKAFFRSKCYSNTNELKNAIAYYKKTRTLFDRNFQRTFLQFLKSKTKYELFKNSCFNSSSFYTLNMPSDT
jgi:hypothetical protein